MSCRRSVARRACAASVAVIGMWAVGVSSASASEYYYFGSASNNEAWPQCSLSVCYSATAPFTAPLYESTARTVNGQTVCAATTDTAVVCSSDLAVKSLCGCTYRTATSRGTTTGGTPVGRARMAW